MDYDDDDEMMGDELDELLEGDGDVEIVGRRRRRRKRVRRARRRLQTVFCGIPSTTVIAGQTVSIDANVAEPFRPERLVATAVSAGVPNLDYSILDIKIGVISQNLNSDPVPIIAFSADAVGVRLRGSTSQPGVGIETVVRNDSAADAVFRGVYIGPALTA